MCVRRSHDLDNVTLFLSYLHRFVCTIFFTQRFPVPSRPVPSRPVPSRPVPSLLVSVPRPLALQLLRRFPEPKPLRAEAPIVTLLGGAAIPSAREALTAAAAQRTFIACFSAADTRPECAQFGLTGGASVASANTSAASVTSATSTVAVGERVTVSVQLRDTTGAPFAQSGWRWRVELTSDASSAGAAKAAAAGSGLVAATPAGPGSGSAGAAVTIRFGA
jgi:hypothetical protein